MSSNSDSDSSFDDSGVLDRFRLDGGTKEPDGSWTFLARSRCGADAFKGLSKRVQTKSDFELLYNPVDKYLFKKANLEIVHSLHHVRVKLFGFDNGQPITAIDAFAAAMPPTFLCIFKEWLRSGADMARYNVVTFDDII